MIHTNESNMMSEGMLHKQPQIKKDSNATSYSLNENTRDAMVSVKIDESVDLKLNQEDSMQ